MGGGRGGVSGTSDIGVVDTEVASSEQSEDVGRARTRSTRIEAGLRGERGDPMAAALASIVATAGNLGSAYKPPIKLGDEVPSPLPS